MKKISLKLILNSIIVLFLSSNAGWTQELPVQREPEEKSEIEITDRMIDQFASVTNVLNTIQKDGQIEMIEAIEHQGLTIQEFNELVNLEKYPDEKRTMAISDRDKLAFTKAQKQVDRIQSEVEQRMDDAILETGLSLREYEAVRRAYNEDPDVRKLVDREVSDSQ